MRSDIYLVLYSQLLLSEMEVIFYGGSKIVELYHYLVWVNT